MYLCHARTARSARRLCSGAEPNGHRIFQCPVAPRRRRPALAIQFPPMPVHADRPDRRVRRQPENGGDGGGHRAPHQTARAPGAQVRRERKFDGCNLRPGAHGGGGLKLALSILCEHPGRKTGLSTLFHELVAHSLTLLPDVEWIVYAGPGQEWTVQSPRVDNRAPLPGQRPARAAPLGGPLPRARRRPPARGRRAW